MSLGYWQTKQDYGVVNQDRYFHFYPISCGYLCVWYKITSWCLVCYWSTRNNHQICICKNNFRSLFLVIYYWLHWPQTNFFVVNRIYFSFAVLNKLNNALIAQIHFMIDEIKFLRKIYGLHNMYFSHYLRNWTNNMAILFTFKIPPRVSLNRECPPCNLKYQ